MNLSLDSLFSLGHREAGLLFSIHNLIVERDIEVTNDKTLPGKKFWLKKYLELTSLQREGSPSSATVNPIKNQQTRAEVIEGLRSQEEAQRNVLLFVSSLFRPYFDLNIRNEALTGLKKDAFNHDAVKSMESFMENLAVEVGCPPGELKVWETFYLEAVKGISGDKSLMKKIAVIGVIAVALAVTAGFAAPAIGAAIGSAMGLGGAAATSAGLAFLGGGALAVGGYGMGGGIIFIIGGGAVLGVAGGYAAASAIQLQPSVILTQLAQAETIIGKVLREKEFALAAIKRADEAYENAIQECKRSADFMKSQLGSVFIAGGVIRNSKDLLSEAERKATLERIEAIETSRRYYEGALRRILERKLQLL